MFKSNMFPIIIVFQRQQHSKAGKVTAHLLSFFLIIYIWNCHTLDREVRSIWLYVLTQDKNTHAAYMKPSLQKTFLIIYSRLRRNHSAMAGTRRILLKDVLLILLPFTIFSATTYAQCPAVDSHCFCQKKFVYLNYVYCERLGNLTEVTPFRPSNTFYDELHIRYETTVQTVQVSIVNFKDQSSLI